MKRTVNGYRVTTWQLAGRRIPVANTGRGNGLDDLSARLVAQPDPQWNPTIQRGVEQSRARRMPVNNPPKDGRTWVYEARGGGRFAGGSRNFGIIFGESEGGASAEIEVWTDLLDGEVA